METYPKNLVALRWNPTQKTISFRYKSQRWRISAKFQPRSVAEALCTTFEEVEASLPGSIAKAAELAADDFQATNKQRCYIAETPELVYINNPDQVNKGTAKLVGGYYVDTHTGWKQVSDRLEFLCRAAGIRLEVTKPR